MKKFILVLSLLLVGCSNTTDVDKPKIDDSKNRVSFVAAGDNLMHEALLKEAEENGSYDFSKYYQNIKPYIQEKDIAFVNQETVLGGDDRPFTGFPLFNTPSIMAKNLKDVGFNVVNGATNHSLDMGYQGIKNSIDVFSNYDDMTYIGVNDSKEKQNEIDVIEKNGIRIAFLAYDRHTNNIDMPNDYCLNLFDESKIREDVAKAKEVSDFIVVSAHWGEENQAELHKDQINYTKLFVELGVDVVIGTHPHIVQDIEWIEGENQHKTLVAYSIGNLISGMVEEECQLGVLLSLDFVEDDGKFYIENTAVIPVVNHYLVSDPSKVMDTRYDFTVYALKDYTEELAKKHGLNGYNGQEISVSKMKDKIRNVVGEDIDILMDR